MMDTFIVDTLTVETLIVITLTAGNRRMADTLSLDKTVVYTRKVDTLTVDKLIINTLTMDKLIVDKFGRKMYDNTLRVITADTHKRQTYNRHLNRLCTLGSGNGYFN